MNSVTNAYTQDRIRNWYYTTSTSDVDMGAGYVRGYVSDAKQSRANVNDLALVIAHYGDRYFAHVSQITEKNAGGIELNTEVFGRTSAYKAVSPVYVHGVRHLTKVWDITDYVKSNQLKFSQAGLDLSQREALVYELIFRG